MLPTGHFAYILLGKMALLPESAGGYTECNRQETDAQPPCLKTWLETTEGRFTSELAKLMVCRPPIKDVQIHSTAEIERDLDARLASIEGHLHSVRRMLAERHDCDSILIQMTAVKAVMNQTIIKLLERPIETCTSERMTTEEGAV